MDIFPTLSLSYSDPNGLYIGKIEAINRIKSKKWSEWSQERVNKDE